MNTFDTDFKLGYRPDIRNIHLQYFGHGSPKIFSEVPLVFKWSGCDFEFLVAAISDSLKNSVKKDNAILRQMVRKFDECY